MLPGSLHKQVFGASFEAGWTLTVCIMRRQTRCLHAAHRAAFRVDTSNACDRAYLAAFAVAQDASSVKIAALLEL